MLKSPDGIKAMGQDLALEVRVFRDDEEASEVVIKCTSCADSMQMLQHSELQQANSPALKLQSSLPLYPRVV